jgi:hypothetical protein
MSAAAMNASATRDVETQRMTTLIRPIENGRGPRRDASAFCCRTHTGWSGKKDVQSRIYG